jgi:predicted chitinase/peptidoglycan hydrolase-like protein with peptidoglycan-binding domain
VTVYRAHLEHAKRVFFDRLGNPYVYGGMWSPLNLKQGTDCSGLWNDILAAATTGAVRWGRESEGSTTESYRYVGGPGARGPFGLIRAASAAAVPANAPVKVALHHGPGGGARSHMWGELDGVRMESRGGSYGVGGAVTGSKARSFYDSYANDWFYLPGPISEDGTPPVAPPQLGGAIYLGRNFENVGPRVVELQRKLGVPADGEFGPQTEAAVIAYQRSKGLEADGVAGPVTLRSLGLFITPAGPVTPPPPLSVTGGLVAEVLWRIAGRPSRMTLARYNELLPLLRMCLADCGCHSVNRRAMWFGQMFHESGALYYKREIADGAAYEGRDDLGNNQPGDGRRFRGRGFVQLTGRANVTAFSKWMYSRGKCPTPLWFVDHPEQMETDENAFAVVTYYWTIARPKLNLYADERDMISATRAINGGTNGIADRQLYYDRAQTEGDRLLDPPALDPWEELMTLSVPSMSIYANPGEPDVPIPVMIAAFDAHGPHEPYVEKLAREGDADSIRRVARAASGQGRVKTPAAIKQARDVFDEIAAAHPDFIRAAIPTT